MAAELVTEVYVFGSYARGAAAGRAPRDAMLPEFAGLDRWISRTYREPLIAALDAGAIGLQRVQLPDVDFDDPVGERHLGRRWAAASPLHRAGRAVLADFVRRGIDVCTVHLHGRDVDRPDTPYFAGFGMRYFEAVPWCLTEHHGVNGSRSSTPPARSRCTRFALRQRTGIFSSAPTGADPCTGSGGTAYARRTRYGTPPPGATTEPCLDRVIDASSIRPGMNRGNGAYQSVIRPKCASGFAWSWRH